MAVHSSDNNKKTIGLPDGWQLHWMDPSKGTDESGPGASISLELGQVSEFGDSLSMIFLQHGYAPWGLSGGRDSREKLWIKIAAFPPLDAIWTLFMMIWRENGMDIPSEWEAMCRYAADVRQGLWPDRTPPERALQSVYLALAQENLLGTTPDRDRFIEEGLLLCGHVGRLLQNKTRLLDGDLFAEAPAFERYISLLSADRDLYKEDRARGQSYWANIPAEMTPAKTARKLPLLLLSHPVARQFKLWARRDPEAPNGNGYPLLLTQLSDNSIILSADPGQRVQVGRLAKGLSQLEAQAKKQQKQDVGQSDWYDGRNHKQTLCASPLNGTALSLAEVLSYLKKEIGLKSISKGLFKAELLRWAAPSIALLGIGAAIWMFVDRQNVKETPGPAAQNQLQKTSDPLNNNDQPPQGAKGEPLAKDEVISLLQSDTGPRAMRHFALIAGVCGYEGEHRLNSPCRDARAMRDVLIQDYGYQPGDILFLVDKPEPGEKVDGVPTAEALKSKVERFRNQFDQIDNISFLFYYSGHGGYIQGAQLDFGVLEPSGFFTALKDLPYEHRGWGMQRLVDDIKKGVPARHIMVILDACYAGWAGAKGEGEFDDRVRSLWKERAEVVLSAGTKGQRAWEDEAEQKAWAWDGHSAMTAFVLEGLRVNSEGHAGGDRNQDGIVTDEELYGFVRERVPASVKQLKRAAQTPMMFRLDHSYAKSGQFLFVPQKKGNPL